MSGTPNYTRLELLYDLWPDISFAADQLGRVFDAVRSDPVQGWLLTGELAELRDLTVERIDDWDAIILTLQDWFAGVRATGPLVVAADQVWSCAARAVADFVDRVENADWQHEPFGIAVSGFNEAVSRMAEAAARPVSPTAVVVDGESRPPAVRFGRPRLTDITRAAWGERVRPAGSVVPEYVWAAAAELRRVWDHSRRAITRVIRFEREHLAGLPLRRVQEELHWEFARVLAEWEMAGFPDRAGPGVPTSAPPPVRTDPRLEARDQWIYQQVTETDLTFQAIQRRLARLAGEKGWRALGSVEAIRQRAIRYAQQHQLPVPPPRQQR